MTRIDIAFAPGADRYVTTVSVTIGGTTTVIYDIARARVHNIAAVAHYVEGLLKKGRYELAFPEALDRTPMVYDNGLTWKRLVAFRTDLILTEVTR